jgi:hypothetical protein
MVYAQEYTDYIAILGQPTHVHSDDRLPQVVGLEEDVAGGDVGIVTVSKGVY